MKIGIFEIEKWEKNYLKKSLLANHELYFFKQELNNKTVTSLNIKDLDIISTFIYSKIDKPVIDYLSSLKMISTRSTGFDHIDTDYAAQKNISVSNVPYYGENTVAEHTFALILSLSRNLHKAYTQTLSGRFSIKELQGFDLKGKTLGVIGAGKIGLHVIKMAKGFDMKVLVYDINRDNFLSEILDFTYTDMENLLKKSDIITIHTPYNKHTHHIINMNNIKLFKRGSILINTARGGCVETEAIIYGLENNILAGAGLDAFEGEDLLKEDQALLYHDLSREKLETILQNNILLKNEKVVITPHIAFNSREAVMRILDTSVKNIIGFIEGKPQNRVN